MEIWLEWLIPVCTPLGYIFYIMDELPTEMRHTIANFDAKITELETLLAPFLQEEKNLLSRLSPMDRARLNLTVAYAISSIFSRM